MPRLSKTNANSQPVEYNKLADIEGNLIAITSCSFQDSPFTKPGEEPKIEAVCHYQPYIAGIGIDWTAEPQNFTSSHAFVLGKLRRATDEDFPLIVKVGRATWADQIKRSFGQYPFDLLDPSDEELAEEDR